MKRSNNLVGKIIAILLAAICLMGIAGCQKTVYKPDLPKEDIVRIEQAYSDRFGNELDWYDPINDEGSVFCCGIYGEYIVIIDNVLTQFEVANRNTLGIELHSYNTIYLTGVIGDEGVACYAFKDGEFYDLMEVFRAGGITEDELMEATDTFYETRQLFD